LLPSCFPFRFLSFFFYLLIIFDARAACGHVQLPSAVDGVAKRPGGSDKTTLLLRLHDLFMASYVLVLNSWRRCKDNYLAQVWRRLLAVLMISFRQQADSDNIVLLFDSQCVFIVIF